MTSLSEGKREGGQRGDSERTLQGQHPPGQCGQPLPVEIVNLAIVSGPPMEWAKVACESFGFGVLRNGERGARARTPSTSSISRT